MGEITSNGNTKQHCIETEILDTCREQTKTTAREVLPWKYHQYNSWGLKLVPEVIKLACLVVNPVENLSCSALFSKKEFAIFISILD